MDKVNVVLDMKGLSCPRPLIGAKRMVDELTAGQVLLLVSDCPGTQDDLFAWAKQTGNQILKTERCPVAELATTSKKAKDSRIMPT